jgi:signal transduction histidine kinase
MGPFGSVPPTGSVEMVAQEIGRVLLNLLSNAFDAMLEKAQQTDETYQPTVRIQTRRREPNIDSAPTIAIKIADNGPGIRKDLFLQRNQREAAPGWGSTFAMTS